MIEAMKQALEAFEDISSWYDYEQSVGELASNMYEASCLAKSKANELRQAIAELESQEPVAVWELFEDGWDSIADPEWMESLPIGTKLYTHPPQRKPLTDEERRKLMSEALNKWLSRKDDGRLFAWYFSFEVEAAHGIKE